MDRKYDGGKLECRGLLKVLKKLHYYLHRVQFLVEIDTKMLVHQLNQPASKLPSSVVNRWLTWIRLFDFELGHVSGLKHGGPDSLSRRLRRDDNSKSDEEDVEDAMDMDLAVLRGEAERDSDEQVDAGEEDEEVEEENKHERATGDDAPKDDTPENDVLEDFRNVIHYLTTFERLEGLMCKKYLQFQRFATKFLLQDGILFRLVKPNMLL